jgi:hypothetical protein
MIATVERSEPQLEHLLGAAAGAGDIDEGASFLCPDVELGPAAGHRLRRQVRQLDSAGLPMAQAHRRPSVAGIPTHPTEVR